MRYFVAIALLLSLAIGFQSCKQCSECTHYPDPTQKVCRADFASEESYADAMQHWLTNNYHCD